jgi:hypothetical protein
MDKLALKIKLREAIDHFFNLEETHHEEAKSNGSNDLDRSNHNLKNNYGNRGGDKNGRKDYSDVKREFEKLGGPSMVDVMKLIGIKDDDKGVNRSLFRKKVKQIRNKDTGSYYQFDDEELNRVRAALDIKK